MTKQTCAKVGAHVMTGIDLHLHLPSKGVLEYTYISKAPTFLYSTPFTLDLSKKEDHHFANAINTNRGTLTNKPVAEAHDLPFEPLSV